MKASFCTNVFSHSEMRHALKFLKDVGYQGVEFWHDFLVQSDVVQLKEYLDELELDTVQVCPYFNFVGNRDELSETLELVKMHIGYAQKLDCKFIRTFTGMIKREDLTHDIYRQAVEGLRTACDMVVDSGLVMVIETHQAHLADTGPDMLKLLEDVDRRNMKINLQVPLDFGKENVLESVRLLGRHTVHVHASIMVEGSFVYLKDGHFSFREFISALKQQGFDGYISIEHGSHLGTKDPYKVAQHEISYLTNEILIL